MASAKLWTRDFIVGSAINFLLMANYFVLMVVMADYAMNELGANAALSGLTASIFIVGALFARLLCGGWMDRVGRRRMLAIGIIGEVAFSFAYFAGLSLIPLMAVRIMHGLSYGIASTAIGTIVTAIIPNERKGEGVGYFMLSNTLGTAIGPFLGIALVSGIGIYAAFVACAGTAIACMASMFAFHPPHTPRLKGGVKLSLKTFIEPSAVPIGIVCSVIFFGYSSILTFLSPFAQQADLSAAAGVFFIVYAVSMFVSRLFTGRIFDRHGARVVMVPAFCGIVAGMAAVGAASNGFVLLAGAALLGFGIGTVQSCGLTIAVQKAPISRLSLANSTFYVFVDTGVGLGPLILGGLVPMLGYRGLYLSMAVIAVCALGGYLLLDAWDRRGREA